MNRNNKIARKMDDDIFNVQSPLLEEFKHPVVFGEGIVEKDPRRATVCRKVRECIDEFLKEKNYEIRIGYFIIDKELFVTHAQDKININITDRKSNTDVNTASSIGKVALTVAGANPATSLAITGATVAANIANDTKKTLDFFKMHSSELQNRLNKKCKGFSISIENNFLNYITINLKETSLKGKK